jgi:hypothetical protein
MFLWEEKNNFTHETVLEISVWQKKQLTTAHEAIVSYTKQAIEERKNSGAHKAGNGISGLVTKKKYCEVYQIGP